MITPDRLDRFVDDCGKTVVTVEVNRKMARKIIDCRIIAATGIEFSVALAPTEIIKMILPILIYQYSV